MTRIKLLLLTLGAVAACKGFLEVENPGPIEDRNLQTPDAIPSLVTGMSADLSEELDEIVRLTSVAADELAHGGSYAGEGLWFRGIILPEDVNGRWADMHKARFESESGIERIKGMQGINGFDYNTSIQYGRANLFAGLANRLLGEVACEAVLDNGPAEPHTVHFSRAEPYFTEAIRIATAVPSATGATDVLRAAYGARASVRAWQGDWAGAVQDAAQVPTSFVFNAVYSINSTRERNELVFETSSRREYTVFNTPWAQVFGDPRVRWDTVKTSSGAIQRGQDGRTNFFQQRKYTDLGADIPLVKGTEMLVLRAENELRNGNVATAFALINQGRAFHNLAALPVPATTLEAWRTLSRERGAVTWLEARRIWDLRRWYAAGGEPAAIVIERIPAWATRDKCIPISQNELQTNPNLRDRLGG